MTVYVTTKSSCGRKYLNVIEVTYGKDNKRHQRVIKSFGRYETALQKDPQIIEKIKKEYHCTSTIDRATNAVMEISNKISSEDLASVNVNQSSFGIRLVYGIRALYPIWDKDLKLNYKLNYLQENNSSYQGKLSDIAFYLTALKLINPVSHYRAFREQNAYLYDPLSEVTLNDVYNTLSFIETNRGELMKYIHSRVLLSVGRTMTMVFYDCTNVYFETPYDDKQLLFRNLLKSLKASAEELGIKTEALDELSAEPDVIDKALQKLSELADEETCFRMRGLSKEHRYDLPLISIALVIDTNGIPIDFEVFPGNKSEYHTMPKLIKEMVRKYQIKNTIVVADRGLNSLANLQMLKDAGLGFIVAQKVSNLKAPYEHEMLDREHGYKSWAGEVITDIEANAELFKDSIIESDLIYKRCSYSKEGYITDEDGNKVKRQLSCEIMYTFSQKRYERDINQLENDLALAKKAVLEKKDMSPTCSSGWRSLVNTKREILDEEQQATENQSVDEAETNNDAAESVKTKKQHTPKKIQKNTCLYKAESLKQNVIEHRRKLAGYAAVVYKSADSSTKLLTDDSLMQSYHQLVKIEECFRIMKTNFTIRPVYVRKREHIIGHITLCVIALIISRMLEIKLERNNHKLSINEIQAALNSSITAISSNGIDGFFIKANEFMNIFTEENMRARNDEEKELDCRTLALQHYIEQNRHRQQPIDLILSAVGLSPLQNMCSAADLCKNLKIKGDYRKLVGAANTVCQQSI